MGNPFGDRFHPFQVVDIGLKNQVSLRIGNAKIVFIDKLRVSGFADMVLGDFFHQEIGFQYDHQNPNLLLVVGKNGSTHGYHRVLGDLGLNHCPPIGFSSLDAFFEILAVGGFVEALKCLAGQMEAQFSLKIRLEADAAPRIETKPLKAFLFRAVQELLFNIHKHAGKKSADIVFSGSDDRRFLSVTDSGKGFDPDILVSDNTKTGLGLLSLRERARFIGGSFEVESAPGRAADSP